MVWKCPGTMRSVNVCVCVCVCVCMPVCVRVYVVEMSVRQGAVCATGKFYYVQWNPSITDAIGE